MTITHLIAFNIALLAAIASPGPAFLVAVRTTLNAGMINGIAIGLGLGLAASMWTLLALLGLESFFFWCHGLIPRQKYAARFTFSSSHG